SGECYAMPGDAANAGAAGPSQSPRLALRVGRCDTDAGIMDPWVTAYSIACVFGAAIVRGYSGFGFSLLAITALSLALPPAEIVPSIFMLEIAASLHLLPSIWRDIH